MNSPSPPTVPTAAETSAAQTTSNVNTALANTRLANANEVSPFGTVTYSQIGNQDIDGQSVPQYERKITLSPAEQQKLDKSNQIANLSNDMAYSQLGRVNNILSEPMDTGNLQAREPGISSTNPAYAHNTQAIDPNNYQLTQSVNPANYQFGQEDFEQYRTQALEGLRGRMNPQLDRQREIELTRLRNSGIAEGSEAWREQLALMDRQRNDADLAMIGQAGAEVDRAFGQDLQRNQFDFTADQASARMELEQLGFEQARDLTAGQNARDIASYNLNRDMSIAGHNNQIRNAQLQERMALRNQPLNEIAALLAGQQVNVPQFANFQAGGIAPTNSAQNMWNEYNANYSNYANEVRQNQAMMGGLFGLGATAVGGLF
jgi:protein involved in polysaccharide export with SLBB domain